MAKRGPTQDLDRIAEVLVTAAYKGDEAAAKQYAISERTVSNYRKKLDTDATLAKLFARKKSLAEKDWAQGLSDAIREGIEFLKRAAKEGNCQDPDMVHSIAGGLKILSEVGMAKQILDARFSEDDSKTRSHAEPVGSEEEGEDQAPIVH